MEDLSERKYIDEMLQDEDVRKFIVENNIENDEFERYISIFMAYYAKKKLCEGCTGLKNCKQSRVGMYPILDKDNYIDLDYEDCNYSLEDKKQNGKNEHLHLYSTSFMDLSGKIDFTQERAQVLTYVANFQRTFYDNPKQKGLYVSGSYGCGKSFIMGQLAKELSNNGVDVAFVYYPDFVRSIKMMITTGGINEIVNELKTMPVLFLDDFGGENNTDFIRDEVLLPILQYRMVNQKPIFVTSNLKPTQIIDHLVNGSKESDHIKAVRVFERIKTLVEFRELTGKNYRG